MTSWQGLNFLFSLLLVLFVFNLLQSLFFWINSTHQAEPLPLTLKNILMHSFPVRRKKPGRKSKRTRGITLEDIFLFLGSISLLYLLYFDLLKLLSILVIKKYPQFVFAALVIGIFFVTLLVPFIVYLLREIFSYIRSSVERVFLLLHAFLMLQYLLVSLYVQEVVTHMFMSFFKAELKN